MVTIQGVNRTISTYKMVRPGTDYTPPPADCSTLHRGLPVTSLLPHPLRRLPKGERGVAGSPEALAAD